VISEEKKTMSSTPLTDKSTRQVKKTRVTREEKEAKIFVASQWQLMWWRFRRHKVAIASAIIVFLIYMVALFA